MDVRRIRSLRAAPLVLAAITVLGPPAVTPARAHEGRGAGGLRLVVGWGDEPAYTGVRNSVQVVVTTADGAGVTGAGGSLSVEVTKDAERVTLPLQPHARPGATPGDHRAWLTPTRPGPYTFRVSGTVAGQPVDETFTSSPTTFDEVQDATAIQFPARDPSASQLATRIEREASRLGEQVAEVERRLGDADRAATVALVGAAAGLLGLVVAAAVLVTAARRGLLRGGRPAGPAVATEAVETR